MLPRGHACIPLAANTLFGTAAVKSTPVKLTGVARIRQRAFMTAYGAGFAPGSCAAIRSAWTAGMPRTKCTTSKKSPIFQNFG